MEREQLSRGIVIAAVVIVVVAIGVLLFGGGSTHTVYADFSDAGQLVNGDLVTVAGHQVGEVGGITLTDNGLAKIELDITDDGTWNQITTGTRAQIRQLSLTGVANRFVGLTLSDTGTKIPDKGTIGVQNTSGIVDLDVLLDALKPQVRRSLQQIIKTGAFTFSGKTPQQGNKAFRYFNPAISQLTQFGRQVVADRFALDRFVSSSAQVASALSARSSDLGGSISSTASWLGEVASERSALSDSLARAPGVLAQTRSVLRDVSISLGVLNPTLADLQPVAPGLASLLRAVHPTAHNAVPYIKGVQALVSPAEKALGAFPPIARKAVPSINSLTTAIRGITPILSGLRPYIPDQVSGFFTGVGGSAGGYYDANGQYGRIAPVIAANGTSLSGLLGLLGNPLGSVTGLALGGTRTHLSSPCPGGGETSTDGSSPWTSPDTLPAVGTICSTSSTIAAK